MSDVFTIGNWAGAEKEYKLAIELDPTSYQAPYGFAFLMSAMGRHDEAIALSTRAEQLDPLNLRARTEVATQLRWAGRYDEGIERCQTVLKIDSNFQRAYTALAAIYECKGLYQEAAGARQKEWALGGVSEEEVAGLTGAATWGAEGYWRWTRDFYRERAARAYVPPTTFSLIHAQLGEKDQAFEWLEKAYEEREGAVFLKVDAIWDPIRSDPRFHDLRRRNLMR